MTFDASTYHRAPTDADVAAAHKLANLPQVIQCAYCGVITTGFQNYGEPPTARSATRDHIWPKDLRSTERNGTLICCFRCNQLKGNMRPSEWLEYLEGKP